MHPITIFSRAGNTFAVLAIIILSFGIGLVASMFASGPDEVLAAGNIIMLVGVALAALAMLAVVIAAVMRSRERERESAIITTTLAADNLDAR